MIYNRQQLEKLRKKTLELERKSNKKKVDNSKSKNWIRYWDEEKNEPAYQEDEISRL